MKHLYILLFVLPLIGLGQGWEQTFGGSELDVGRSVQQTTDGGYIIFGYSNNFGMGYPDFYLIKTYEDGEEEWFQIYEEGFNGYSVQQTTDGGYIIFGETYTFDGDNTFDFYLIKTDGIGEEEWSQDYGFSGIHDFGRSVQQTTDGGYILCGTTKGVFDNNEWEDSEIYLIKTNDSGEEEWSQTFEGYGNGEEVQQTTDGGYIITGFCGNLNNRDVCIIKTDQNGDEQWSQTFGGEEDDIGWSIQQTTDGGYIITGTTTSFGSGNDDVYLIKTDVNGDEEWSQTFGGIFPEGGYSVQQTLDGGYIITGVTTDENENRDVYLIKTYENGDEEWSQTFGKSSNNDLGYSVQQTLDEGYIITGYTQEGDTDVYLIKTDEQGNVTSTIELPTPSSKRELIKTTNILGQENTTIKNQPLIEIYDDGSAEKKIVLE